MGVCKVCGGVGVYVLDVMPGDPRWGVPQVCECRRAEIEARRLARLQNASNLMGQLLTKTFENYRPRREAEKAGLEAARAFAGTPNGWLVLIGTNGIGKTHLAAAIANQRIAAGLPALFMVVPDLLDYLRDAFRPNAEETYGERFEMIKAHPLLILDDMGGESSTPWAMEKLFQLINHRYNATLPTVITSNVDTTKWQARLRMRATDKTVSRVIRMDGAPAEQGPEGMKPGKAAETINQVAATLRATL